MIGDPDIVAKLNDLLASEMTAVDQYFLHSRMYENWGLHKLHERIAHEMSDEMEHADKLLRRILFLEGVPQLGKRDDLNIGTDVPSMLKNDLALEMAVIDELRHVMALCESKSDFQTREVLGSLLTDTEEDHVFWLETQLGLIDRVGLQNYLQSQMS